MQNLNEKQAVIIKGVGGHYVLHRFRPFFSGIAVARGIFRKNNISPLPGDIVQYSKSGDPDIPYVIDKILPRKNQLKRPPMANLDVLLITVSTHLPAADFFLVDRLISHCILLNIEPVLLLTKIDLAENRQLILDNYLPTKLKIYELGNQKEDDLVKLKSYIKGLSVAFAGQSGAGKSTLINRIFEQEKMLIGDLSEKVGRGKQTTRHIELFPDEQSYIADTPGFQTIQFEQSELSEGAFANSYPEIKLLSGKCKFKNCTHSHEPGCAVKNATENEIYPDRLKRYYYLRDEIKKINQY